MRSTSVTDGLMCHLKNGANGFIWVELKTHHSILPWSGLTAALRPLAYHQIVLTVIEAVGQIYTLTEQKSPPASPRLNVVQLLFPTPISVSSPIPSRLWSRWPTSILLGHRFAHYRPILSVVCVGPTPASAVSFTPTRSKARQREMDEVVQEDALFA
ncbi:hypothetical protein EVAR_7377_1 [Eumeta japonica]|uniref:Uncharacterized protein n=1 Tax=Eumeta variegata TaxID=151549 RepID=A0A4C1V798_EUMVA|nr:hypothetical protein EVAR_7377_1 [Eumeta japonica]